MRSRGKLDNRKKGERCNRHTGHKTGFGNSRCSQTLENHKKIKRRSKGKGIFTLGTNRKEGS